VSAGWRQRLPSSFNVQLWVFAVGGSILALSRAGSTRAVDALPPGLFTAALDVDPDFALGHFNLGVEAQGREQWEDALEHYRRAARADPDDHTANLNWGQSANHLGLYAEARDALRASLTLDGNDWRAHQQLGTALARLGSPRDAAAEFEKALRLQPEEHSLRLSLGASLEAAGDQAGAERSFRMLTEQEPNDADAWFNLGVLLKRRSGRGPEAIRCFERAVALDPRRVPALGNLAELELGEGNREQAAVHLRALLEVDPSSERARALLNEVERTPPP
jgi:tetratricopeptide (TPR) repeat protein